MRARVVMMLAMVALNACGRAEDAPSSTETGGGTSNELLLATGQAISARGDFTCALIETGSLKCWGINLDGQLGVGDTVARGDGPNEMSDRLPFTVLGRPVLSVSAGLYHACAVLDNNQLKCWGWNGYGQLGLGDNLTRGDEPEEKGAGLVAVDLGVGRSAKAVSCGYYHTCAILDNNQVKCWGNNAEGELGYENTYPRGDGEGQLGDTLGILALGSGRTAKAISAGAFHTCAILDNNQVKCWGYNAYGQLGYGDTNGRGQGYFTMGDNLPVVSLGTGRTAKAISAGEMHTCAILDNNQLKCWGSNGAGQLGYGDTANRGGAANQMGDTLGAIQLGTGRFATVVSAGGAHTCAVLDNAQLKCWGSSSQGQLGYGDTLSHGGMPGQMGDSLPAIVLGSGRTARAVAASAAHTCVVLDTGQAKCWGSNGWGQLGQGDTLARGDGAGEMGDSLPPISVGSNATKQISVGLTHVCAILSDNRLKCWGSNASGELGLGDANGHGAAPGQMGSALPAVDLGPGRTALSVAAGSFYTCAILDNSQLKCWGYNDTGQLGLGDTTKHGDQPGEMGNMLLPVPLGTGRTAKAVSASRTFSDLAAFTCAILDNNTVKCWGNASVGQLGLGNTTNRGDQLGEMGDMLPIVQLGTGRTAKAISVGGSHACAILDNNTVKCWGGNAHGQLGYGDTNNRGDGAGEMGDALPIVPLGTGRTAKAIGTGYAFSCAVLDNDQVKCWGQNASGQLGVGSFADRGDNPGELGDNQPTVPLGTGRTALGIALGDSAVCALLDTKQVRCWGAAFNGTLGNGDGSFYRGDAPNEIGDYEPTVALGTDRSAVAIAGGYLTMCARLDTNQIKCWGWNYEGELGAGDTLTRGDQPNTLGDFLPVVDLGPEP